MRRWMLRLATGAVVITAWSAATPAAQAADRIVVGADGRTAPVFDYNEAIRERVYIPQPGIDQDRDGVDDRVVADVIRPKSDDATARFPAIIDPSPYYTTSCRGNEAQCIADTDGDDRNDRWPLFYDNYFLPRGYAYVLAHANGTAGSSGCPLHGGPADVAGEKSVVDWLNGRVPGYTTLAGSTPITAEWHNGSSAMIGKSYDGTFSNGVAATGVEGLKTIVPISAISDWYKYSRQNGIRFNTHYPAQLSGGVTNQDRRALCAPTRDQLSLDDGDATGDVNPFWDARNYLTGIGNVKAAVFATHGLQDDNVKMDHLSEWWEGLGEQGVPRKLWLLREGHVDPFDSRRAVWVDTLHRWFDHWLVGVDNGIMAEPAVDIEESADQWRTYDSWPVPGTTDTEVFLRGTGADTAGALGLSSGGDVDRVSFTNAPSQTEAQVIATPTGAQTARRVFLSPPLKQDLRLSGTPRVQLDATLSTDQSNLAAVITDYGEGTQIARSPGDGVRSTSTRTCWGASPTNGDFSACYLEVSKIATTATTWRVTRGILDSSNRSSLRTPTPVTPGEPTSFDWPLVPHDHVFKAGHQIAIAVVGDYRTLSAAQLSTNPGTTISIDTKRSKVVLPLVGGYKAAVASGAFAPDTTAPAIAVSDDLTVGAAGADGVEVDYAAPAATDDEDPAPTAACQPASGTTFPVGDTTVTCTAADASGNERQASFVVRVTPAGGGTGPGGELPAPPAPAAPGTPTPVSPAPADGPAQPTPEESPTLDRVPPRVSRATFTQRSRRGTVRFRLGRAARVTVTVKRNGSREALKQTTRTLRAGRRAVRVSGVRLRKGRYTATIVAVDADGNRTRVVRTLRLTQ